MLHAARANTANSPAARVRKAADSRALEAEATPAKARDSETRCEALGPEMR